MQTAELYRYRDRLIVQTKERGTRSQLVAEGTFSVSGRRVSVATDAEQRLTWAARSQRCCLDGQRQEIGGLGGG